MGVFCRGGRGERGRGFCRLCVGIDGTFIGSKLGEGATCFSRVREFRWGNQWKIYVWVC